MLFFIQPEYLVAKEFLIVGFLMSFSFILSALFIVEGIEDWKEGNTFYSVFSFVTGIAISAIQFNFILENL